MLTESDRELSHDTRGLLDELASMETRERAVLGEIIHDEPMQLIIAALMRLELFSAQSTDADADELEQIGALLETSIVRLRQLVVALAPPDLRDGLGGALRDLADGIFIATRTRFHLTGPMHVHISIPSKEAAYRIFREAMVNVRKHANAANVTLHLDEHDTVFVLTLTDDGVGSATLDAGPGHLGMATMRTRAAAEGGLLIVHSTPGSGTTVQLTLPAPESSAGQPTNSGHRPGRDVPENSPVTA